MIDTFGVRAMVLAVAGLCAAGVALFLWPGPVPGPPDARSAAASAATDQAMTEPADGLVTPAQSALDRILGPGHAVVAASASYGTGSTRVTRAYDPRRVAALKRSQVSAPGYTASTTDNGISSTLTTTVVPAGAITRLSVDVVVDSGLRPAPSLKTVRQTVSAALGLQPRRGDTLTISRMPLAAAASASSQAGTVTPAVTLSRYVPSATAALASVILVGGVVAPRIRRRATG